MGGLRVLWVVLGCCGWVLVVGRKEPIVVYIVIKTEKEDITLGKNQSRYT